MIRTRTLTGRASTQTDRGRRNREGSTDGTWRPVWQEPRNGLPGTGPEFRPYVYGAPRPGWAVRAITAAEAQHGPPVPTCLCGGQVVFSSHPGAAFGTANGVCRDCGTTGGGT